MITLDQRGYFDINASRACSLPAEEVARILGTDISHGSAGLTIEEAETRKKNYGLNEFNVGDPEPLWKKYLEQFKNPLILLLLGSAFVSICMSQLDDAFSIALAVLIVSTVAFVQEYRSEKSLEELSKLLPDYCTCVRKLRKTQNLQNPESRKPRSLSHTFEYFENPHQANEDSEFLTLRIPARELVPGDLVFLKAGDRVPADIRFIKVRDLRVDESGFTGEAHPVKKTAEVEKFLISYPHDQAQDIKDHQTHSHVHMKNIGFMGTLIRSGKGIGIVIGTGEKTEFGEIFKLMKAEQVPKTPLQKSMDKLGKQLSLYSLIIIFVIMAIGYIRGRALIEMFTIGVSLAVAAIPEGLPIVVTVTLALGVIRMSKRRVIVKKLPTVETLGRVNVLCSDKTGTLTTNHMSVTDIYLANGESVKINDSSSFPTPLGIVQRIISTDLPHQTYELENGQIIEKPSGASNFQQFTDSDILSYLTNLSNVACICSDVPTSDSLAASPTESALFELKTKLTRNSAIIQENINFESSIGVGSTFSKISIDIKSPESYERVREIPFSSERKYMQIVCRTKISNNETTPQILTALKGAPEIVLSKCDKIFLSNSNQSLVTEMQRLTDDLRAKYLDRSKKMAQLGLRVLAVAFNVHGPHTISTMDEFEGDVAKCNNIFLGFVGIQDPVKPNVPQVIKDLKRIGVKVKMITGDAKETAYSIAQVIGLLNQPYMKRLSNENAYEQEYFMSGQELDKLSGNELALKIDQIVVFYRTSPIHKIKIVKALQDDKYRKSGNVVAMTGDGINDALALKKSDIGIAVMSMQFKDAAKEMSTSSDGTQVHIDMSGDEISKTLKQDDPVVINTNDACKEAADMLFLDGDLTALTVCIDEGKTIYENIRNFLRFQLSTSISALSIIAISTIFFVRIPKSFIDETYQDTSNSISQQISSTAGISAFSHMNTPHSHRRNGRHHNLSPLNAMQILWINIIMDGPPAQSLGVEPPDEEIVNRPPRDINDPMLTYSLLMNVCLSAVTIVTGTIWVFVREMRDGEITPRDTTMTFTCFVLFDMFNALSCRSQKRSIFSIGLFSNRIFIYSIFGSIVAQLFVVYTPFFQNIFQTESLTFHDWCFLVALTSTVFWISEIKKCFERNYIDKSALFKNLSFIKYKKKPRSPSTNPISKFNEGQHYIYNSPRRTTAALNYIFGIPKWIYKRYKYMVIENSDTPSDVNSNYHSPKTTKIRYELI